MLNTMAGIIIAGSPLLIGELFARLFKPDMELARKIIHVLASFSSASLVWFFSLNSIAILGVIYLILLVFIRRFKIIKALYGINRHTYGELLFPVGVSLAALIASNPSIYVVTMIIVGLSDTAACLIGRRIDGVKHYWNKHKTWAGSLAFATITAILLFMLTGLRHIEILLTVFFLTTIEAYSLKGSDNVTVAIAAALALNIST